LIQFKRLVLIKCRINQWLWCRSHCRSKNM